MTNDFSKTSPPPVRTWPLLALLAASLVALGGYLADELIEGTSWAIDPAILLGLRTPGDLNHPIGPAWLQQSAVDISALGGFTLMCLFGIAGLVWLLAIRKRAEAAWIAASMVGSAVIDALLKHWIARPRPTLVPHLVQVQNASFPSGHAMTSAAVYLTLALMLAEGVQSRGGRVASVGFFAALVVLIGCSRSISACTGRATCSAAGASAPRGRSRYSPPIGG